MSNRRKKAVSVPRKPNIKIGSADMIDPAYLETLNFNEDTDDQFDRKIESEFLREEKRIGEIEYTKNVIKALQEAIKENDELRKYVSDLNEENGRMKKELEEKDGVIKELAEYYEFCQVNHINEKQFRKRDNNRKRRSKE